MPDENTETRLITRNTGRSREIAVIERTPENDAMTDEQLFAGLDDWKRGQRHLRSVDEPE